MKVEILKNTIVPYTTVNYYVDCVNGDNNNIGDSADAPLKTIGKAIELINREASPIEKCAYNIHIIGDYVTDTQLVFSNIIRKVTIVSNDESQKSDVIVGRKINDYNVYGNEITFNTDVYPSSVIVNGHVISVNSSCDLHYPTEVFIPDGVPEEIVDYGVRCLKIKKPSDLDITFTGNEIIAYHELWRTFVSKVVAYDDDYIWAKYSVHWGDADFAGVTFRVLNNSAYSNGFCFEEDNGTYSVHVPFDGEVESVVIPTELESIKVNNCVGLSFNNVRFVGSRFHDVNTYQASANAYGSIMIEQSAGIVIEGCEFEGTYGYSVMIGNKCYNCRVENNYFHDLFGGAVHVSSYVEDSTHPHSAYNYEKSGNDDTIKPSVTHIKGNLIKGFGRIDSNCCGILARFSKDNYIVHNTICDGYYTGIDVGYTWAYGQESTEHNYVAYNHVHHCLQYVTSDGGGIYMIGQQPGTIVEYNKVHDITAKAKETFVNTGALIRNAIGIYLDQASTALIVRYNLVYGCDINISLNFGRCNKIFNNLAAYSNTTSIGSGRSTTSFSNQLCLLSNMLIEKENGPSAAYGLATIYINTIVSTETLYNVLKDSLYPLLITTPTFRDLGNGLFQYTDQIGSDTQEGNYKFYRGFLIERKDTIVDDVPTVIDVSPFGVTDDELKAIAPLFEQYVIDGQSENYNNYYRKLQISLTGKDNPYLLSVADDPS